MISIPVILVMLGVAALLWGFGIEPKLLKTSVYRIRQPELAGLKIVFASDFHAAPGHERRLRKIVGRIAAQQADMILLGGDFVKGRRFEKSMPIEKIAPILAELHAPLGVYAVLGNHDWRRDGVRIADVLQKHGIEVLENENRRIDHAGGSLWLAGLADCNMRRPDVRKALENAGNPVLVITHSPDIFPQVTERAALTLAGHTHGGQVALPWLGALLVPSAFGKRYEGGLTVENGKRLLVSRGLGTSLLPVRFNCRPEIVVAEFE